MSIELSSIVVGNGGFVIHGEDVWDYSGFSVASAGDVNGDGFGDLIVGAPFADGAGNARDLAGDSYVVLGKSGGFGGAIDLAAIAVGSAGFVIRGEDAGDRFGYSVASAGDVNGDGFGDLIVGAPHAQGAGNAKGGAGGSYVVFGKSGGFGGTIDLSAIAAGSGGFVIHGEDAWDWSGHSVASAGDVNGDGFDDLIVGAPRAEGADSGKQYAGRSYVVFGKAGGFGAVIDLSAIATGLGGFVIHGEDADDVSGGSVASAGDVNGDGFGDLIVGAFAADGAGNDQPYAGGSYVVFGRAGGFGAAIDLSAIATGSGGFVIRGEDAYDRSGDSVALAGDVNGDGFGDLIIGASYAGGAGNGHRYDGRSYIVFGAAGGFGAAIDLSGIASGSGGFVIHVEDANDTSGSSVASAGDVNGDGLDDLLVGAFRADGAGNDKRSAGASYVVFGRSGGFGAAIELSAIAAGNGGFVIHGEDVADFSGVSVASAGDVNGDGFADVIVGATGADGAGNGKPYAGGSYVVFGRDFTASVTHAGSDAADLLTGTAVGDVIVGGRGADTLDGGAGGLDAFSGGEGDDVIVVATTAFRRADGGSGSDTLRIVGSGVKFDLTSIADTRIQSIEAIDLTGQGDNTLWLNALEVLNVSDNANVLRVTGNAGDSLRLLDGGWSDGGNVSGIHVLSKGQAVLQVDQAVSVALGRYIVGTDGADNLTGSGGIDLIVGLAGNDTLAGSDGDDTLDGGTGNDTLDGGGDGDTASYAAATGPVTVSLAVAGAQATGVYGSDTLVSIENLIGSDYADRLTGNALANTLDGGKGPDTMLGGLGPDTYIVDDAGDVIEEMDVDSLVSSDAAGVQANSYSRRPSFSPDGRYVLFESGADNLVAGDTNTHLDLFVKDLQNGAVERVSTGAAGQQADDYSGNGSFSSDGRYVVFESDAANLVAGDTNVRTDIFVKDLQSGAIRRVSSDVAGSQANHGSYNTSFSADGRYVLFESYADNLVAGDTNGAADIFVKDLQTGSVRRVSVDSNGAQRSHSSYNASFVADGSQVVFTEYHKYLLDPQEPWGGRLVFADIFIKNLVTGALDRVAGYAEEFFWGGEETSPAHCLPPMGVF